MRKLTDENFNDWLIGVMKDKSISKTRLAREMGANTNTVNNWVKRGQGIMLYTLCRLLDVLGYELYIMPKEKDEE